MQQRGCSFAYGSWGDFAGYGIWEKLTGCFRSASIFISGGRIYAFMAGGGKYQSTLSNQVAAGDECPRSSIRQYTCHLTCFDIVAVS